jgi:Fe-S-cluster formation regulator IscX/YfhJ
VASTSGEECALSLNIKNILLPYLLLLLNPNIYTKLATMAKKQIINYQEKWKEEKHKVEDLVLDTKNVRLGGQYSSEAEIINDLFINENAFTILQSIYQNGYFPDEPPVVIKERGKLIVLEGNRRVASLKAMIKPEIAPPKFSNRIKKLMSTRQPMQTVSVHIANSRNEAMEYLAAKHTVTTRKPWSALRRAYFYYAQKEDGQTVNDLIERYKTVDIPQYIKMHEMHNVALSLKNVSDDTLKKMSNKSTFNISTLERVYNDKYVQEKLGIDFDKKTGEAKIPASNDFDQVFSRVVSDIASGIATSRKQLMKDSDRKQYIDSVVKEVIGGGEVDKKSKKSAASFRPGRVSSGTQLRLVPKHFEDTLNAPGVGRVLHELQTIDYHELPNATADLLRTFLEIVLKKYLQETGNLPAPKRAGSYIFLGDVLNKLKSILQAKQNRQLVQVITEIENNKWYLDSINHNPDVFAVGDRVKDAWDQVQPLIKFIFDDYTDYLSKNPVK